MFYRWISHTHTSLIKNFFWFLLNISIFFIKRSTIFRCSKFSKSGLSRTRTIRKRWWFDSESLGDKHTLKLIFEANRDRACPGSAGNGTVMGTWNSSEILPLLGHRHHWCLMITNAVRVRPWLRRRSLAAPGRQAPPRCGLSHDWDGVACPMIDLKSIDKMENYWATSMLKSMP